MGRRLAGAKFAKAGTTLALDAREAGPSCLATAVEMGALALLGLPLLLPLLTVLLGQPLGVLAQSQGTCWTEEGGMGGRVGGWEALTSPLQLSSLLCEPDHLPVRGEHNYYRASGSHLCPGGPGGDPGILIHPLGISDPK